MQVDLYNSHKMVVVDVVSHAWKMAIISVTCYNNYWYTIHRENSSDLCILGGTVHSITAHKSTMAHSQVEATESTLYIKKSY